MALYATNRFPGDGTTTSYEFNFVGKYIARTHVKVYQEDNATKVRTYVSINDSNFLNDTTLRSLPVTPVGSTLVIYRDTPKPPIVDFVNGSRFTEYNLDLVARQGLFVAMEALDAGGSEARQQLLDAIAVVVGLVDDATAAGYDATAAALAAASSASTAQDAATLATSAKTAAEAANTAAQGAKTAAQGSASASAGSASAASTSASNAANSATASANSATTATTAKDSAVSAATTAGTHASTASTQAATATTQANVATTKASEAAASATNAAASAASIDLAKLVNTTAAQTIAGVKTFTSSPVVPSMSNPSATPANALNYAAAKACLVINAWPGVTGAGNHTVHIGWHTADSRLVGVIDSTPIGTIQTSASMGSGSKIGAVVFAHYNVSGSTIGVGAAVNGADLRPASPVNHQGVSLPGVWTCLGYCVGSNVATSPDAKTMFIRTS